MGLLTGIVTLPLAPVRGVIWLAGRLQEQAEWEVGNQDTLIRQLEELDDALAAGQITAEEAERAEALLLAELAEDRGLTS